MLYGGQAATYAVRLAAKYGQDVVEELERKRWEVAILEPDWYEEKIEYYSKLVDK